MNAISTVFKAVLDIICCKFYMDSFVTVEKFRSNIGIVNRCDLKAVQYSAVGKEK